MSLAINRVTARATSGLLGRLLRPKTTQSSTTAAQRRRFASDMPTPQSSKAELWEGHPKVKEGWETTVYLTYAAAAVILTVGLGMAPESNIQTWAMVEAQTRLDLLADGSVKELKFGTHYSTSKHALDFEEEGADNPFNEEDDDDDEDDEEEEGDGKEE